MFENWKKKRELRAEAIAKARNGFANFNEILRSDGWKVYSERIEKKIEYIKSQFENNTEISGEDLKKLQLALKVYREVQRIPKELEEKARGGK